MKDTNMEVSVIVPVYNVEPYLRRCVDSLLEQTFNNFELLLIDDGSTDKSGILCDELGMSDDRIKVYHKENGGLSDARNYGIDRANGEYYTFIDSDDYVGKDFLKTLVELIHRYDAEIAIVNAKSSFSIEPEKIQDRDIRRAVFSPKEALDIICRNTLFGMSAWGKMYHRDLFKNIRYPKGKLYEDLFTTPYLIDKSNKVAYCSTIQYFWFQREDSIMHGKVSRKDLILFDGLEKLVRFMDDNYKELHQAAICRYVNDSFWTVIQRLVFNDEYEILIDDIIKRSKKYWLEGLKISYISIQKKVNIVLLLFNKRLYRKIYSLYKK